TEPSTLTITVYNSLGQKIQTIYNGHSESGYKEIKFNAENLSSGIYFYSIEVQSVNQNATQSKLINKMILLK
ncbi:MAG: T9SS type A sorting domain-containing protein, partial [Ignavibacterium sp.]